MSLTWVPDKHTYENADTGKLLSQADLIDIRNQAADDAAEMLAQISEQYVAGDITFTSWKKRMAIEVADAIIGGYVLGRGGDDEMTNEDADRLLALIEGQQTYLDGFADDAAVLASEAIEFGWKASAAAVIARARQYAGAVVHAFSRGNAASYGGLDLPYFPADGGTPCFSACRCSWQIDEDEDGWSATWTTEANPCDGCEARAIESSPYTQAKT